VEIPSSVLNTIRRALEEDLGPGDITTSLLIPEQATSTAQYTAKETFVLAGFPFAREVFRTIDPSIEWNIFLSEGSRAAKGDVLAEISGKTSAILIGERLSLNILQRLSGIATLTSLFVDKISGLRAKIVDTRKTSPCHRFMEKYAVRTGGGNNHRFGLFDGILIKDNHIHAVGSVREAIQRAKTGHHLTKIEVEVDNLADLGEAIEAGADIVMLDNMPATDMKEAVRKAGGRVVIEASGGVTLENVREIAETGVDLISVGALTHSAAAADISLKIVE
jgi:nicotinate-nucleotide pyrophosphorylase (carboxylating)